MSSPEPTPNANRAPRGSVVQTMQLPDRRHELLALEAYQALRSIALGEVTGAAAQDLAHVTAARLDLLGGAR